MPRSWLSLTELPDWNSRHWLRSADQTDRVNKGAGAAVKARRRLAAAVLDRRRQYFDSAGKIAECPAAAAVSRLQTHRRLLAYANAERGAGDLYGVDEVDLSCVAAQGKGDLDPG